MASSSPSFSCFSLSSDSDVSSVSSPDWQMDVRSTPRRRRCRSPGGQRRNASEKEKLRMRDLTKALHYLRSFLPPSVAPSGQTLTKIETLRLAIRYISYLSTQLHLQMAQRQNPELTSPQHDAITHTHSAGNQNNQLDQTWTPLHQTMSASRLDSEDVLNHMLLQSERSFIPAETGRGAIKVDNSDCGEIFGFHTLTNPRVSQPHQDSGEDELRKRTAHDVWI